MALEWQPSTYTRNWLVEFNKFNFFARDWMVLNTNDCGTHLNQKYFFIDIKQSVLPAEVGIVRLHVSYLT